MKAFFTIEAIFVIFLLPFLLYFAVTAPSVSAKTKLAEKAKMELAYDILASWDRQGTLDYSHTTQLGLDTDRLSKESGQCLTLRGTSRKMTVACPIDPQPDPDERWSKSQCHENVCVFRTVVSNNCGNINFDRIFLCVE